MLMPVLAAISPTALVIVAVSVAVALALIIAGTISARRAANLPKAQAKKAPVPKALEPKLERPPEPSAPLKPPKAAAPPPSPPLSADERRRQREEEEAHKKEAYRLKKEAEAEERERRRQEEQEKAAQAAEEARRLAEEEGRRAAEAKAEEARKVQAQAGRTLADGLAKTRGGFMSRLNGLLGGGRAHLDDQLLAQLEEVLFSADIGVKTASQLLDVARTKLKRGELADPLAVKGAIRQEIERIIETAQGMPAGPTADTGAGAATASPEVWMIVGVNGAGKTTTIGKLAAQLAQRGEKVVVAAADTFRAAATDQLAIWAQRSGAELVRGPEGGDPGSVAFEAVKRAREIGAKYVLVDTAGRLHTKAPLMEELRKVKRVLQKAEPGAPHQILLVLDSTNGQNAIAQARQFHESLQVSALVLTKLDGTAKGGVVIGIADELRLPVRYIGVGEQVEDLQPFGAHAFVEALFS